MPKRIHTGFTLLETLLVVVIIAILALSGINFYQGYSADSKINKTAQQMQLILQAAAAYYTDFGCWPNSNTCPTNSQSFTTYIAGINNNPWGNPYTYQVESLYQKKFQVLSGFIPGASPNPLVQRVIAQLANSGFAPTPNQVLAEITLPKKITQQQQSNFQLISISTSGEVVNTQPFMSDFQCPTGWRGAAAAIPYFMTTSTYDKNENFLNACKAGSRAFANLSAPALCSQSDPNLNTYHCNFIATFTGTTAKPLTACTVQLTNAVGTVRFAIFNWCYSSSIATPIKKIKNSMHL